MAFPLTLMCRVLQVSRAGFYAWRRRAPSPRRQQDTQLQVAIAASHRRSTATYGSRRILRDLHDAGHCVSRKRVARLMRAAGLRGIARRRFRVTTQSQHAQPVAPNLLARQFAAGQRPRVWAADLTYCWTAEGWLYLAVLLDLTSRRVVGWATSARLNRQLVLTALERALALRGPSREPVRQCRLSSGLGRAGHRLQPESPGQLLRQRRGGEFLRDPEAGAAGPAALADPPRGRVGPEQVH